MAQMLTKVTSTTAQLMIPEESAVWNLQSEICNLKSAIGLSIRELFAGRLATAAPKAWAPQFGRNRARRAAPPGTVRKPRVGFPDPTSNGPCSRRTYARASATNDAGRTRDCEGKCAGSGAA